MKHVKLFFALFAMLALGVGNAWSETITLNNLGAGLSSTSNTTLSTTVVGDYTLNYLQGKKQESSILLAKGKDGGTSFISNKTPIPGAIQSVTVHINSGASGKTTYHCAFSTTECTSRYVTGSTAVNITGGNNHKYTCSVENASYFCVALGNNNNGQVLKLEIEYTPASSGGDVIVKTLKSIAVEGMTTDYETGDMFKFDGTCTATYGVTKNDMPQADETKEVTPTSVSTPDMSTAGEQEVTVTYTEDEVTVTATYTINVTENEITEGEYELALNNTFFGTTAGANVSAFPTSAKQDDITVTLNGAGTKTRTDADCVRMYTSNTLTFSVPAGYVITSITFAEPSSTKWDGSITVNVGSYTEDDTKSWAGSAQEVVFSFGAQNRIATATVTYAAAGETPDPTPDPEEPEEPVVPEGPENLGAKTIAEFLELKNTTDTCVLTGVVANIANTTYGNFDLVDATGSVYVYGLLTAAGESKQFASMDIAAGDTLTVKAIYNEYNSNPQAKNAIYVSHTKAATPIVPENLGAKTIAEFLELKNTTDTCVLTGVVANIANTEYGNFDLVDATGSVYVYGLLTAAGENKQFASMDIAAGDTLTVKAIYNEFNSKAQAKNAIYVSHSKLVLTVKVTSENGRVDGLADGGKYVRGAEATLTATANEGYEFVNWTSGETEVSTENPYTFNVTADVALVANFKKAVEEYTITLSGLLKYTNDLRGYTTLQNVEGDTAFFVYNYVDDVPAYGEDYTVTANLGELTLEGTGSWKLIDELETITAVLYNEEGTAVYNVTVSAKAPEVHNLACTDALYVENISEWMSELTITGVIDEDALKISVYDWQEATAGTYYQVIGVLNDEVYIQPESAVVTIVDTKLTIVFSAKDELDNTYNVNVTATPKPNTPLVVENATFTVDGDKLTITGQWETKSVVVALGGWSTTKYGEYDAVLMTGTGEADDDIYAEFSAVLSKDGTTATLTGVAANWDGTKYDVTISGQAPAETTTALDNVDTAVAPAKVINNGQLIIIRNGVQYNAQGAVVQ